LPATNDEKTRERTERRQQQSFRDVLLFEMANLVGQHRLNSGSANCWINVSNRNNFPESAEACEERV